MAEQGKAEEGVGHMRRSMAALEAIGVDTLYSPLSLLLAEAYNKAGRAEEGFSVVAEVLAKVHQDGSRHEAELYRLKGELTLQKFQVQNSPASGVRGPESEAEECFLQAIEIARRQQAKSLELRAVMSLSRLWQQRSKKDEARQMLAKIYGWFIEGFDTADLQEAKALLEELGVIPR